MLKSNKFFWLALLWTVTIAVLSFANPSKLPEVEVSHVDKIAHFGVYFLLTILWFLYATIEKNILVKKAVVTIVVAAFLYGLLIEALQDQLTKNRSGDYLDLFANTFGIIIAAILCNYYNRFVKS